MPKRLRPELFNVIYAQVPRLCVEAVIVSEDGVALSKRDIEPEKGKWHIPGGTVLFGESLKDAVRRVAKEEVGLDVSVGYILGTIEYPRIYQDTAHTVGLAIVCYVVSGELSGGDEGREVGWFTELPDNIIQEQGEFLRTAHIV